MADQTPRDEREDNGLCTEDAYQLVKLLWGAWWHEVRVRAVARLRDLYEFLASDPFPGPPDVDDEPPPTPDAEASRK